MIVSTQIIFALIAMILNPEVYASKPTHQLGCVADVISSNPDSPDLKFESQTELFEVKKAHSKFTTLAFGDFKIVYSLSWSGPNFEKLEPKLNLHFFEVSKVDPNEDPELAGSIPGKRTINQTFLRGFDPEQVSSERPLEMYGLSFETMTIQEKYYSRVDYGCWLTKVEAEK